MLKKIKRVIKKIHLKSIGFAQCGKDVLIGENSSFAGAQNIYIGDNVQIGRNAILWSTNARLVISSNVILGPNVSIHTGNHEIRRIGKNISDVKLDEIGEENFGDVIIESDTWIGDGVKVLKGVHIGRGSVIGAGSVVTHDTEPYGIYVGVPAQKISMRFEDEQIVMHERYLKNNQ